MWEMARYNKYATMKEIAVLGLALIFFTSGFAQTKPRPNFSGEWQLDESKSVNRAQDAVTMILSEESAKVGIRLERSRILTIVHVDPELRLSEIGITKELDRANNLLGKNESRYPQLILFTDDRKQEEMSTTGHKVATQTEWKGSRILSTATSTNLQRTRLPSGRESSFTVQYRDTIYSLSDDGKELTIESWTRLQDDPARRGPTKLVYRRMESPGQAVRK